MPQCLKRRVPCHHWTGQLYVLIAQCYTLKFHFYNLYDYIYLCLFLVNYIFPINSYLCIDNRLISAFAVLLLVVT